MLKFDYIWPLITQVYSCGDSNIPLRGVKYLSCLIRNSGDKIALEVLASNLTDL